MVLLSCLVRRPKLALFVAGVVHVFAATCSDFRFSGVVHVRDFLVGVIRVGDSCSPRVGSARVRGACLEILVRGVLSRGLFHISCRCSLWRCMRLFFHGSFNLGTLRHCCLFVRNLFLELSKTFRSTCFPGHEAQSHNMRCIGDLVRSLFKSTNSRRCEAIQSLIGLYKGDSLS